jgi:hypothetical protein
MSRTSPCFRTVLCGATLAVFQVALDQDFAPAWNEDARLRFAEGDRVPAGAWEIVLANHTDTGSLGYHWTAHGAPIARVFVSSTIEARDSWEKCSATSSSKCSSTRM